jgi:hypothetical protein
MERLDVVKKIHLLKKEDWLAKLDLRDAYLTVPVWNANQPFLRLRWKGIAYQFVCLPFGLVPAPRVFTKILKLVMTALHSESSKAEDKG